MLALPSSLDIFESPALNASVDSSNWTAHLPIASLQNGPIEFNIPASEHYYDLSKTTLHVQVRVNKGDGSKLDAASHVSTCNNLLHSLFSKCDVYLGGTCLTDSAVPYNVKSYLEMLLNFSEHVKNHQLRAALYYNDHDQSIEAMKRTDTTGYSKRKAAISNSKVVDLGGRLHFDLANQEKYIINHLPLRVVLHRAPDSFVLISDDAGANYKVEFVSACLYVRKVKVSDSIMLAHAQVLSEGAICRYPYIEGNIRTFAIPQGLTSVTREHLFLGKQIPLRVTVGFVNARALSGSYDKNPYRFQHYNINHLAFSLNGVSYPSQPFSPNFADKNYARSFLSVFEGAGILGSNKQIFVNYDSYRLGNSLFCIDLTSDHSANSPALEVPREGSLSLTVKFAEALPENIVAVLYAEFESEVKITHQRQDIVSHST